MSNAPLSPKASALILDELAEATPEIGFDAEPAAAAQPYVFGQSQAAPIERLTGLERIGDRTARALRPAIEPIARTPVTVTAAPIEVCPYEDWRDEQPAFAALALFRARPLKGCMLVQIEAEFIAALVEIFYGGAPTAARKRKPGDFSASEELLRDRVLDRFIAVLAAQWNELTTIELTPAARETALGQLSFVRADEPVAVQRFAISAGTVATTISVVTPLATLRPMEEALAARSDDSVDSGGGEEWRRRLGRALEQVELPVRSVLARPEISVAELLALKPGDVIPITLPPHTPLLAGTRAIATGVIGEQDGRAALRIDSVGKA